MYRAHCPQTFTTEPSPEICSVNVWLNLSEWMNEGVNYSVPGFCTPPGWGGPVPCRGLAPVSHAGFWHVSFILLAIDWLWLPTDGPCCWEAGWAWQRSSPPSQFRYSPWTCAKLFLVKRPLLTCAHRPVLSWISLAIAWSWLQHHFPHL